ncbi:MAG: hypothetical protein EOO77_01465 [Oxalobacteraceae bacterium]|nr:MAG: hypothetical protein EOO77_01465 [Oxalobacteraceae bacterium]
MSRANLMAGAVTSYLVLAVPAGAQTRELADKRTDPTIIVIGRRAPLKLGDRAQADNRPRRLSSPARHF